MSAAQSRNFMVRVYGTQAQVFQLATTLNHYAYILHDKDIYHDTNENHTQGDKKAPHWHILCNLTDKITVAKMRTILAKYQLERNAFVQIMKSAECSFDYLTHATEKAQKEGKYQYPDSDVITDNPAFYKQNTGIAKGSQCQNEIDEDGKDKWVEAFDTLINAKGSEYSKITKDLVHSMGRDFILNSHRLFDLIDRIKYYESRFKPTDKTANNPHLNANKNPERVELQEIAEFSPFDNQMEITNNGNHA